MLNTLESERAENDKERGSGFYVNSFEFRFISNELSACSDGFVRVFVFLDFSWIVFFFPVLLFSAYIISLCKGNALGLWYGIFLRLFFPIFGSPQPRHYTDEGENKNAGYRAKRIP